MPELVRRHLVFGLMVTIGSLGMAVLGWLVLGNLATAIRDHPEAGENISPLAMWCIEHRNWIPALAFASTVAGVILTIRPLGRGTTWLVYALSFGWLAAMFALILYTFISFLAPMYEYQPL